MVASIIKPFLFSHSAPHYSSSSACTAPPAPRSAKPALSLALFPPHSATTTTATTTTMPPKPARDARNEQQTTFRFLTRSHPDDFKDDEARQDVRSHVMRDYRRKNSPLPSRKPSRSRPKLRHSASDSSQQAAASASSASAAPGPSVATSTTPTTTTEPSSPSASFSSFTTTSPITSEFEWPLLDPYRTPPRCDHADRSNLLLGPPSEGVGPFPIPTFIPREWRRMTICCRCLGPIAALRIVPPALGMLSTARLAFLASLFSEYSRRDLIFNAEGKCREVLNLEAEAIANLNDSLADARTATKDETVCCILSLMIAEAMAGNDSIRNMHVNGLESVVARLGGLANIIDTNELIFLATQQLLIMSALFDQEAPAMFQPSHNLYARQSPWSEAPSFPCPLLLQRLERQAASDQPYLIHMLNEMQELTAAFLGEQQEQQQQQADSVLDESLLMCAGRSAAERGRACWYELARHPCVTPVNARHAADWLYEACRIAGMIYCTAVVERLPFPAAASLAAARLKTPMLLEMLCSAIYQSDLAGLWGDMAGAYVWAVLVGGCAANGSADARIHTPPLVRRWMIFPAMSCLNFMATRHVNVFTDSLRTMVRVQQVLRLGQ